MCGHVIERAYPESYQGADRAVDVALVVGADSVTLQQCRLQGDDWHLATLTWEQCQSLITGTTITSVDIAESFERTVTARLSNGVQLRGLHHAHDN